MTSYSKDDQLARKKPPRDGTPAERKKVYAEVTEAARAKDRPGAPGGQLICALCNKAIKPGQDERDHIKTRGAGGKTVAGNLRLLCRPCHRKRHGQ